MLHDGILKRDWWMLLRLGVSANYSHSLKLAGSQFSLPALCLPWHNPPEKFTWAQQAQWYTLVCTQSTVVSYNIIQQVAIKWLVGFVYDILNKNVGLVYACGHKIFPLVLKVKQYATRSHRSLPS